MAAGMAQLLGLLMALQLFGGSAAEPDIEAQIKQLTEQMETTLKKVTNTVDQLSRQVMMQQLFMEERIRSDGGSGLKQTRQVLQGTKPYHANTAIGGNVAAMHDHPNEVRTMGSGEFVAVLNGVEFRTRHNDYLLAQPEEITNGSDKIPYDAVKDIEFPDVPPEVTSQADVQGQFEELRQWFKAWKDQDYSVRDYRKYFKPILCVLEGGWTISDENTMEEPFYSKRHYIDAKSWHDLQEKVKITASSGRKNRLENYAFLPTTIVSNGNETVNVAQWNYRIFCHPLKRDLSTKRLILIDDITSRIAFGRSMDKHNETRAARYKVAPEDKDDWSEEIIKGDLLDELMAEIPGKDGYGNELSDDWLDGDVAKSFMTRGNLSAGYYHRWFKSKPHAMGFQAQHRGFSDENLFMAKTTQEKIAPMSVEKCIGETGNQTCSSSTQRWTYAIPLELIYLTPLLKWNPYNVTYTDNKDFLFGGKRDGKTKELALNGSSYDWYFQTPPAFFTGNVNTKLEGDTGSAALWVRDGEGVSRMLLASGTRTHLPLIHGVGKLRTRYPIMPLHSEGGAAWKELTALKNIVLKPEQHSHMFYGQNSTSLRPVAATTVLIMKQSRTRGKVEPHVHLVYVPLDDLAELVESRGKTVRVTSEEAIGHTHSLILKARGKRIYYSECDGERECWDSHPRRLDREEEV